MSWGSPAPAIPAVPEVSPDVLDAWRVVARSLDTERPYARFWLAALRRAWPKAAFRTGDYVAIAMALPHAPGAPGLDGWVEKAGFAAVAAALHDHVAAARALGRLRAWLEGGGALDAEARALLDEGDFAGVRWRLARPRHLATAQGAIAACQPYITEPIRPERV
ncbi:hypothetical protein D3C72_1100520 [compost metagenome]